MSLAKNAVIPYVEPKDDKGNEFGSTLTSTLPMAAVSATSFYLLCELLTYPDVHTEPVSF